MTGAAPLVLLLLGQQKYAAAWTQPHASCCLGMGSTYASSALGRLSASRSPVAAAPLPRPSINSNSNSNNNNKKKKNDSKTFNDRRRPIKTDAH